MGERWALGFSFASTQTSADVRCSADRGRMRMRRLIRLQIPRARSPVVTVPCSRRFRGSIMRKSNARRETPWARAPRAVGGADREVIRRDFSSIVPTAAPEADALPNATGSVEVVIGVNEGLVEEEALKVKVGLGSRIEIGVEGIVWVGEGEDICPYAATRNQLESNARSPRESGREDDGARLNASVEK